MISSETTSVLALPKASSSNHLRHHHRQIDNEKKTSILNKQFVDDDDESISSDYCDKCWRECGTFFHDPFCERCTERC
jgi:arginyl-tRNA--protein-N-Asp/Glu arginylyltransferase